MLIFEQSVYSFDESAGTVQGVVCVVLASGTITESTVVTVESGLLGDSASGVLYMIHDVTNATVTSIQLCFAVQLVPTIRVFQ